MSEKKTFTYEIGGKKYTQKPLTLGQIEQIIELLSDILLPNELTANTVIKALGISKVRKGIAIALCEEGKSLRHKDIDEISMDIAFEISPETTMQVVEDFFDCNPIVSLFEKLTGMTERIKEKINQQVGLKKSSASSAQETSQKETASAGATP